MGSHGLRSPCQGLLVEGPPCRLPRGGGPQGPGSKDAGLDPEGGRVRGAGEPLYRRATYLRAPTDRLLGETAATRI